MLRKTVYDKLTKHLFALWHLAKQVFLWEIRFQMSEVQVCSNKEVFPSSKDCLI